MAGAASKQLIEAGKITSWSSLAVAALGSTRGTGIADPATGKVFELEGVLTQTTLNYVSPALELVETYVRNDGELTPANWASALGATLTGAVSGGEDSKLGQALFGDLGDEARRTLTNLVVAGALSHYDKDAAEDFLYNSLGNEVGQFIGQSIGEQIAPALQAFTAKQLFDSFVQNPGSVSDEFAAKLARTQGFEYDAKVGALVTREGNLIALRASGAGGIFAATSLFAAFASAMSQSSVTGGGSVNDERTLLAFNEHTDTQIDALPMAAGRRPEDVYRAQARFEGDNLSAPQQAYNGLVQHRDDLDALANLAAIDDDFIYQTLNDVSQGVEDSPLLLAARATPEELQGLDLDAARDFLVDRIRQTAINTDRLAVRVYPYAARRPTDPIPNEITVSTPAGIHTTQLDPVAFAFAYGSGDPSALGQRTGLDVAASFIPVIGPLSQVERAGNDLQVLKEFLNIGAITKNEHARADEALSAAMREGALAAGIDVATGGALGLLTKIPKVAAALSRLEALAARGATTLTKTFTGVVSARLANGLARFSGASGVIGEVGEVLAQRIAIKRLGETVIQSKFKQGAVEQGLDFLSFTGKGDNAKLIINEVRNATGNAGKFTALGEGARGTAQLGRNLEAAERAIKGAGLDEATANALRRQLQDKSATIRLIGNSRTVFRPERVQQLEKLTGFRTEVGFRL